MATSRSLEDVGGRGLPYQRLLSLVEQPHIFDGDDRLIGEGLQQRDLVGCERSSLTARYGNRADRLAIPQHGHGQCRSKPTHARTIADLRTWIGQRVRNIDRRPFQNGAPAKSCSFRALR